MALRLTELHRYPVKSCAGEPLDTSVVERWGLAGDRRWLVVDEEGAQVTAREHPRLLLVRTVSRPDGGLDLSSPDAATVRVDVPDGVPVPVRVWRSALHATPAARHAHDFFSSVVGRPVRLVYLDDPTRRHPNPRFSRADDVVSFADGYPLLVTSRGSLDALNELIAAGPRADEGPVPMARFRPNLVVDGAPPWAEDGWRRLRVGRAVFRAVKGCDRCVMTTTDPVDASRGKEPLLTLSRHRRWDGATWFGMNLIPDTPGKTIGPGDEVEVLESVAAPDGPPR